MLSSCIFVVSNGVDMPDPVYSNIKNPFPVTDAGIAKTPLFENTAVAELAVEIVKLEVIFTSVTALILPPGT